VTSGPKYAEQRRDGIRDIKGTRLNYVRPRNDLLEVQAAFQRLAGTYLTWEGFFLSGVTLANEMASVPHRGPKCLPKNIIS